MALTLVVKSFHRRSCILYRLVAVLELIGKMDIKEQCAMGVKLISEVLDGEKYG